MYEVSVEGRFSATHRISLSDGTLEPVHSHEWKVRAVWRGPRLDERGLLVDFGRAEEALGALMSELNDSYLNDHPLLGGRPPSAENLSRVLFEKLGAAGSPADEELKCVSVTEAPGCVATYERD
jgi:6-pyruvoyltetrahydropterin/6-carboxytetrahydropterin synthase